jgi:quinol monooxygenase YgiN
MKLTSEQPGLLRSFGDIFPPDADPFDQLASLKPCSLNGIGLPPMTDAQAGTRVAVLRGMLRLSLTLSGSERQLQQLIRALRSLSIGTRIKQGCLGCRVCLENDGEGRAVQYVEMWATEADIRRHIRSDLSTGFQG